MLRWIRGFRQRRRSRRAPSERGAPIQQPPAHKRRLRRLFAPLARIPALLARIPTRLWSSELVLRAAVVLGCLTGGELLLTGSEFLAAVAGFGLGFGLGALLGALLSLFDRALRRAPRWLQLILWLMLGSLFGGWLAHSLGVLARFGGKDHKLALVATALCGGLAVIVMLTGVVFQSKRNPGASWFAARRRWFRIVIRLGLLSVAGGCIAVDNLVYPDSYAEAHTALRVMAVWFTILAVTPVGDAVAERASRLRRSLAYGGVIAVFAGGWTILALGPDARFAELLDRPFGDSVLTAARAFGDFDRDGYSMFLRGGDCEPFDPSISPVATEIPGNGIDDNCRLGDASRTNFDLDEVPIPTKPSPRSVVLITVDTVHAGQLSLYGNEQETSPVLDAWAEGALVFARAHTTGGWTSLATSSMLRGVYPRELRWTRLVETSKFRLLRVPVEDKLQPGEEARMTFAMPIEDRHKPLPWWLARRGMRTVAVVNDGYAEFLDPEFVGEGFDRFVDMDTKGRRRRDVHVTRVALRELKRLERSDEPFFLWIHYFGPHDPSSRTRGVPDFGNTVEGKYQHEIRAWDTAIGPLLEHLDGMAEDRPLSVIVTADHGEWVRKKRRNHGNRLNGDVLRIPMVIKDPDIEPGWESAIVSLVDIAPTIMALTGTPGPGYFDGIDLRTLEDGDPHRILIADTWRYKSGGIPTHNLSAAFDGKYALVVNQLKQRRIVVRQKLFEGRRPKNLHGKVDASALERAMDEYLEASGSLELHD